MKGRARPTRTDPRRPLDGGSSSRLRGECGRGIAVGGASGLLLAAAAGAAPWVALLAALGSGATGALIGVLLWSGSDAVPEDRVPPPRDG